MLLLLLGGCQADPEVVDLEEPPELKSMEASIRIVSPDSLLPSDAIGLSDCSIVLAGPGRLLWIPAGDSGTPRRVDLTTNKGNTYLSLAADNDLVVWQRSFPGAWRVRGASLEHVAPLPRPVHPWGGLGTGQIISLSDHVYASPTMTASLPRRNPEPWPRTPLVQVFDSLAEASQGIGSVRDQGGLYLSWLHARSIVGSMGDTLVVVNLSSGVVDRFEVGRNGTEGRSEQLRLPRTFSAPPAAEEVWEANWLDKGGEVWRFYEASQIANAAFSATSLYVVRNYEPRWMASPSVFFERKNQLVPSRIGLEIYSWSGRRLASFALPSENVRTVNVGRRDRLFVTMANGVVLVYEDPLADVPECEHGRSEIDLARRLGATQGEAPFGESSGRWSAGR